MIVYAATAIAMRSRVRELRSWLSMELGKADFEQIKKAGVKFDKATKAWIPISSG